MSTVPMAPDPQRRSAAAALAVTLVVAAVALVVDAVVPAPDDTAGATTQVPLVAGASTCAAGEVDEAQQLVVSTLADAMPAGAATAAEDPWATLVVEAEGRTTSLAAPALDGAVVATPVTAPTGPVAAHLRWERTPVLLSRRWTVGEGDRVPGTVEGPCPTGAAERWHVPGVATAGGAAARLHLANPADVAASVQVRFSTPDGLVEPIRLANLVVPAHGRTTIDLNQFAPEEPDLGVEVIARAGTFVAEAEQTLEAAVGGVDGRSLVVAHPQPAVTWTLPMVSAGGSDTPWVWVTNPTDQPTDVGLVVHTPDGPVVPPAGGATLAPHTTQRIDLRGALGDLGAAAVTVRSTTDVPVVVGGAVVRSAQDDAVRGGVAVLEATAATGGRQAALSATGAAGRSLRLGVANPGEEPAVVTVRVVGGGTEVVVADALALPAGSSTVLTVEGAPGDAPFAVVVDVAEGVAAATLFSGTGEGPLDLTAALARPFPSQIVTTALDVRREDELLHPIVPPTQDEDAVDAGAGEDVLGP